MVKQVILKPGRTYQEFSLLPALTRKDCIITNISLETRLHDSLPLRIPILSAAMTSVTGYDMALALGKEGGLGVLPAQLQIDEQAGIVKKIKQYEMSFVDEPTTIRDTSTIEEALRLVERQGHSKIPVIDRHNVFKGMFDYKDYLKTNATPAEQVTCAMIQQELIDKHIIKDASMTVEQAKSTMLERSVNHLVVLDSEGRLDKLAFKKDEEKIKIASAISTHSDWQMRTEANINAGVDLLVIDTSDAHNEFAKEIVKQYKQNNYKAPLCVGNIVTYEGAMYLMNAGADIIKVGMSSGSICITKREKAVGRAPVTALMEAARARRDYLKQTGRRVPIIMDGGITCSADMVIALTIADAVMLGGYLNGFYESAGEKFDEHGKITTDEHAMREVATWGEGSRRAQNLGRYGHSTKTTFFPEGVEGTVLYKGRLKPGLTMDLIKIKAAMSNAGCYNLKQLREEAVIELNSPYAGEIIGSAHSIKQKM